MDLQLKGNKGEWSEIYIFLKLIVDGKIYAADKDMQKIADVYLNIIKIIREEIPDYVYEYYIGDRIQIFLNGTENGPTFDKTEYERFKNELWRLIQVTGNGNISSESVENFLRSIHITKLKAPAAKHTEFFGGTQDIFMTVMDYRSGITSNVGFSCKSEFSHKATLFNASKDNTNFRFKIIGGMDDEKTEIVNRITDLKGHVAISERINFLKINGMDLLFTGPVTDNAKRNIILSGGLEMPDILGEMLKNYYWYGNGETAHSSFTEALNHVIEVNPVNYPFVELESIYRRKIGNLLYDMFTGMRLSKPWNGRSNVNGGYIVAQGNGDVLAYHSCMADEFKDFLVESLGFESPSSTRHNAMSVYKENDGYFINFNLQIRFK